MGISVRWIFWIDNRGFGKGTGATSCSRPLRNCKIPQSVDAVPFHFEHIIAKQHGGPTRGDNLAYSRANCNAYKGTNTAGIDPITRRVTPLFHPRRDEWQSQFRWSGPLLVGLSLKGRTTICVLKINDPLTLRVRDSLMHEGLYE
jgi:hypothetical protein